jgi:hypothetical protein
MLEIPKFQSGLGAITYMQHADTKIFTVYLQYNLDGNFQYLYCFYQKIFVPRMSR